MRSVAVLLGMLSVLPAGCTDREPLEISGPEPEEPGRPPCAAEARVELLFENRAVGRLLPSPDGRRVAALVNYKWVSPVGDLVVLDLESGETAGPIARDVFAGGLAFTHDGAYLVFAAGVTRLVPDGHATFDIDAYDLARGDLHRVGADVVRFEIAPGSQAVAYQTPSATFVHDLAERVSRPVAGGDDPCLFESDTGFTCHPLRFVAEDRLLFVGGVSFPSAAGSLAVAPLADPAAAVVLATEVVEAAPGPDGTAVLFARAQSFDADPDCRCPRADVWVSTVDGSFSLRLLEQARYGSASEHAALGPRGDRVAFVDPDRNPTVANVLSLPAGEVLRVEPELTGRSRPYFLAGGGVVVWPLVWTGSQVDGAMAVGVGVRRVRLGEEVRGWTASRPEPASAARVVLVEAPKGGPADGPARVRFWDARHPLPRPGPVLDLDRSPLLGASKFDRREEDFALLVDEGEPNWRGRLLAVLADSGATVEVSGSARARAPDWAGEWVVFLEDTPAYEPAPLGVARPRTQEATLAIGASVSLHAPVDRTCPTVTYVDCASYAPPTDRCQDAIPGIYRLHLPR